MPSLGSYHIHLTPYFLPLGHNNDGDSRPMEERIVRPYNSTHMVSNVPSMSIKDYGEQAGEAETMDNSDIDDQLEVYSYVFNKYQMFFICK
jgi:hypothetical protein